MKKIFLLIILCTTIGAANTTEMTKFDDWIVCHSCSQASDILCDGYYKPLTLPSAGNQSAPQPIKVTADAANFVAKGTSVFNGNVIAAQGDKLIYADKATVVHNSVTGDLESITAYGNVKIMQPGMRVDGSKAVAYIGSEKQVIDNAVYRLYDRHARGDASAVIVCGGNNMHLDDSTYTTCAPDSNAWYLKASSTEFNKETGRGAAWHARMYVKDIPIFYWPYVNFPIDKRRQTGFLIPAYENSSLNGHTVIAPFYWNMAPNYDATLTSSYMTLRSFKFDTIFRYLTTNSNGTFNFDFLPHDRAYQALRDQQYADPQFMQSTAPGNVVRRNDLKNTDLRYRFALKHTTNFNPNWMFNIDFTTTSDGNYLYDFRPNSPSYVTDKDSIIYALQRAALHNCNRLGAVKVQVERYESYHVINGPSGTEQLSKLPGVYFASNNYDLPKGFEFLLNANYIYFRPNVIPGSGTALSYGQRFYARPALSYPIIAPGWFIIPRLQVNYVLHDDLTIAPNDLVLGISSNSSSVAIPMYDLRTGLIFERAASFRNKTILQTLEPQLYYLYVPQRSQDYLPNFDSGLLTFDYYQVFRDNRYTGYDYVSDANQLGMGIASKFYDAGSGAEMGMLALGKIRYFRDSILLIDQEFNNYQKNWSPYAFLAKLHLDPDTDLEANLVTYNNYTYTGSFNLQYHPSPVKVINFSYQYVSDPEPDDLTGTLNSNLNQIGASSAWQVSAPWRLLGKINYDLRFHRYLETLLGFEYHTCCTALRAVWSRMWLPEISSYHGHDNIFRIQFIFKGFAGVGNAENRYIAAAIPGYSAYTGM